MTNEKIVSASEAAPARRVVAVTPRVDIHESAEGYLLVADLPGVADDAVDITLDRNLLTLSARRADDGLGEVDVEYRRTFQVPSEVDADGVKARLSDGVIQVTLPRAAALRPRKVAIEPVH